MTITYNIEMIKEPRRAPQGDMNAGVVAADRSLGAQPHRAGRAGPSQSCAPSSLDLGFAFSAASFWHHHRARLALLAQTQPAQLNLPLRDQGWEAGLLQRTNVSR